MGANLEQFGFMVEHAATAEQAARLISAVDFDVVVSDIKVAGTSGVALLRTIRSRDLDLPLILVTGHPRS